MKSNYDFRKGRRGAVLPVPHNKIRITIRLDQDVVDWYRGQVEKAGAGSYQTLINDALRDWMQHQQEPLEDTLRRVLREELVTTH